jgi:hypothetical protein
MLGKLCLSRPTLRGKECGNSGRMVFWWGLVLGGFLIIWWGILHNLGWFRLKLGYCMKWVVGWGTSDLRRFFAYGEWGLIALRASTIPPLIYGSQNPGPKNSLYHSLYIWAIAVMSQTLLWWVREMGLVWNLGGSFWLSGGWRVGNWEPGCIWHRLIVFPPRFWPIVEGHRPPL